MMRKEELRELARNEIERQLSLLPEGKDTRYFKVHLQFIGTRGGKRERKIHEVPQVQ